MKIGSIIKWSAIAGGLYYIFNKVTTAQALTSEIAGVKLGSLQFPNLNFTIQVAVTNPTNSDATATSFTGTLNSPPTTNAQATTLANFNVAFNNNSTGIVIPANSKTILNVNAQANLLNVGLSVLTSGLKAVLNATVVVDGISIPLNSNIEITTNGIQMSGIGSIDNNIVDVFSKSRKKKVVIKYNAAQQQFSAAYKDLFFDGVQNDERLIELKFFKTQPAAIKWANKIL